MMDKHFLESLGCSWVYYGENGLEAQIRVSAHRKFRDKSEVRTLNLQHISEILGIVTPVMSI